MHLFTATGYEGDMTECDEGELVWIPKDEVYNLNLWEGDKIFFRLLEEDKGFFTLKVKYEGDKLISSEIRTY
jgi:8-oxo-dGTP diphosphatase